MIVDPAAEPGVEAGEDAGLTRVVSCRPLEGYLLCEDPSRAAIFECKAKASIASSEAEGGGESGLPQNLLGEGQPATGSSNRSSANRRSRSSSDESRLLISVLSLR